MKILHIHASMQTGGIESMVNALANEMSKTQKIEVCSIFKPRKEHVYWNSLNPKIRKFTLGKQSAGFSIKVVIEIFQIIRRGKYDVVNVHGFFQYYFLAVLLLHRTTKFFYTIHSDATKENSVWEKRMLWFKRFCFAHKWMRPITISEKSQQSFENLYQCDSRLIKNGVPTPPLMRDVAVQVQAFRINPTTRLLINVGRIDIPKNQKTLCRCAHHLIKDGYDIVLLIAGPIVRQDIFDEMKPYFSQRIVYIGEIHNAREYFAECDAFVMPSIWEGLPVTLLEAMSVGCIPICTPVGGIPDVITDGENGILSSTPEKEDFNVALHKYMSMSSDEILKMKKAAIDSFNKSYKISQTAMEYIKYYFEK